MSHSDKLSNDIFFTSDEDKFSVSSETVFDESLHEVDERLNQGPSESVEDCLEILEKLNKLHFEKNVENKVLQKCIDNIHMTNYLYDHVFHDDDDDDDASERSITEDERIHIIQLLHEKEEKSKAVSKISKENRELEHAILNKRLCLKENVQKRKKLWDKAAKMYVSKHDPEFEKSYNEDTVSDLFCSSSVGPDKMDSEHEGCKSVKLEIAEKLHQISDRSRILHLLISFCGVRWTRNKHFLELLLCTGEILSDSFDDAKNYRKLRKVVNEVNNRLNSVKI